MSALMVIEAGLFICGGEHDRAPKTIREGVEYRVHGRVVVEKRGVDDDGLHWAQQGVLEAPLAWSLDEWPLVRSRELVVPSQHGEPDMWTEWATALNPSCPLASEADRAIVALALHRSRRHLDSAPYGYI